MSTTTTVRENPDPSPGRKWWLPVLLAVLIAAIVAGAYFASHPHLFSSATSTPTATPRPAATATAAVSPTPAPTGTPAAGPTGTPRPGPTGTPIPGPSATPRPPAATATPATLGVRTGAITHPVSQINTIQQQANRNDPNYTFYLDPQKVVMNNLGAYGFKSGYTIVSPAPEPAPTATPYTNPQGLPETQMVVQYQGKKFLIILDQPVQKGPQGIWVITTIKPQ